MNRRRGVGLRGVCRGWVLPTHVAQRGPARAIGSLVGSTTVSGSCETTYCCDETYRSASSHANNVVGSTKQACCCCCCCCCCRRCSPVVSAKQQLPGLAGCCCCCCFCCCCCCFCCCCCCCCCSARRRRPPPCPSSCAHRTMHGHSAVGHHDCVAAGVLLMSPIPPPTVPCVTFAAAVGGKARHCSARGQPVSRINRSATGACSRSHLATSTWGISSSRSQWLYPHSAVARPQSLQACAASSLYEFSPGRLR